VETTLHGTTILCVCRDGQTAVGGDGQVTFGNTVMKATANKIRRLHQGRVVVGFAGATADAFTLFERLEGQLDSHGGILRRAAVALAKDWRTDRYLRRLEAMLIAADKDSALIVSGTGDVVEPEDGVLAIGSGGPYAMAAARALIRHSDLNAEQIVAQGLKIAGEICIYTNQNHVIEVV